MTELIPDGHKEMLSVLAKVPDSERQKLLKTRAQKVTWDYHSQKWLWTMRRIDFLQMLELGYRPRDPFDLVAWEHPKLRQMLVIQGNFYYAILKVMIKGFDLIEEVALSEGQDFHFRNPRELFAEICREDANYGVSEVFGTAEEDCLARFRAELSHESAFFRGRLGSKEEEEEARAALKYGGWGTFWLYAIWHERFKKTLRSEWKVCLKHHKEMCSFLSKKNLSGNDVRVVVPRWTNGIPLVAPYNHVLDL